MKHEITEAMITYSVISTEQESPTQSCGAVSREAAQRRRHLPVSYCCVTNTPKLRGLRQLICFYLYGLVIYAELGWTLLLMVVLADLCGLSPASVVSRQVCWQQEDPGWLLTYSVVSSRFCLVQHRQMGHPSLCFHQANLT